MLQGVLRVILGDQLGFWCPGCESMHVVDSGWTFNGNYDRPTFTPSILVTGGHYLSTWKVGDSCWCTFNKEHPDCKFVCGRCHSFVTDGSIQFLDDCSHALKNQIIRLEPPDESRYHH